MTKPLSPRETQIARLWVAGSDQPSIARALGLKRSTVSVQLMHIRRKLGIESKGRNDGPAIDAIRLHFNPPTTPTTMPTLCTPPTHAGFKIHQQVRIDSRLSGHNGRSGIVCDRSETGTSYEVMLLDAPGKPRRRVWFNADELQEVGV